MAISLGITRPLVHGDSDLVIQHVMKEWDIRSESMTAYYAAVKKLEGKFEGLELVHIPRVENEAADTLAKLGSTRKAVPPEVFLEHLHEQTIMENPYANLDIPEQSARAENGEAVQILEVIDLIQEVLVINPDWTVPFIAYLLRKEPP